MGYVDIRDRKGSIRNRESVGHWKAAKDNPYISIAIGIVFFILAAFVNQAPRMFADPWFLLFADPWFLPWMPSLAFLIRGVWQFRRRNPTKDRPKPGAEKQLLMAIRNSGGLTAVEAALETTLTVDEAEALLSRLADRGHLFVRSREGALYYELPGERSTGLDNQT